MLSLLKRLLRQLSRRRRRQLVLIFLLMLASAAAEVLTLGAVLPFLAIIADPAAPVRQSAAERVLAWIGIGAAENRLLYLTLLFAATAVCASAVRIVLVWASNKYVYLLGHELAVRMYGRILHQPYSYHLAHNSSEVLGAIQKVQIITSALLLPLLQSISSLLIGLVIVAVLIVFDPLLSSLTLGTLGGTYIAISLATRRRLRRNSRVIASAQSARIRSVQEGLGGIRDVLLDGTQAVMLDRFRIFDGEMRQAQAANGLVGGLPRLVIEATVMALIASLAFLLSVQQRSFASLLPVLGALAIGMQRLLPLLQTVFGGWVLVLGNLGNASDVLHLLEKPPAADVGGTVTAVLPFKRDIVFRNVSFQYATGQTPVIQHVNFVIPKGARVGLVGKTGSGKSTTVDLLAGLLAPTNGSIEVDGRALDDATRAAWRRRVAHVPQNIFLADASIAENIAFGVEPARIDPERVQRAAQQAAIAGFVESLPARYDSPVGERGVRLSGGQRQRIGIARALYKNAMLLVFDEATNALDTETEAAVLETLEGLDRRITIILIAHRASTVAHCDLIVALGSGMAVQVTDRTPAVTNRG